MDKQTTNYPSGLFHNEREGRGSNTCDVNGWRWAKFAACAGTDPEAWFMLGQPNGVLREICEACSVQPQCLSRALQNDEFGFWAGTTREERRRMRGLPADEQ